MRKIPHKPGPFLCGLGTFGYGKLYGRFALKCGRIYNITGIRLKNANKKIPSEKNAYDEA